MDPATTPTMDDSQLEDEIRDAMRRCPDAAIQAAMQFRTTQDPKWVPTIVFGIIERFVEPAARECLRQGSEETRLIEDLGVDSLLMMEIVMVIEDVLKITIENDELRELRTLGQVESFILAKLGGEIFVVNKHYYALPEISASLPHAGDSLFLTEAVVNGQGAHSRVRFPAASKEERCDQVVEAMHQLAALFLLKTGSAELCAARTNGAVPILDHCAQAIHEESLAGSESVDLKVHLLEASFPSVRLMAEARNRDALVTEVSEIVFHFASPSG